MTKKADNRTNNAAMHTAYNPSSAPSSDSNLKWIVLLGAISAVALTALTAAWSHLGIGGKVGLGIVGGGAAVWFNAILPSKSDDSNRLNFAQKTGKWATLAFGAIAFIAAGHFLAAKHFGAALGLGTAGAGLFTWNKFIN